MRKILFITPYSGRAGAEVYLKILLDSLDSSKYQVTILCLHGQGEIFSGSAASLKLLQRGKKSFQFRWMLLKNSLFKTIKKGKKHIKEASYCQVLQQKESFDLWIINTILPCWAQELAREMGVCCITIVHEGPKIYSLLKKESLLDIIQYSDEIWGCSEKVTAAFRIMGAKKLEVIHPCFAPSVENDISQNFLRKQLAVANHFVCICVGTMDPNKGLDLVISLADLCKDMQIKFIWVGRSIDSGYSFYLEKMREQLNVTNIIFVGEQAADLSDYYKISDLVIIPSHYETFSLVALEAIGYGKPVMAYADAAYNRLLNFSNSKVLESRDPNVWKEALEDLIACHHSFDEDEIKKSAEAFSRIHQVHHFNTTLDHFFQRRLRNDDVVRQNEVM